MPYLLMLVRGIWNRYRFKKFDSIQGHRVCRRKSQFDGKSGRVHNGCTGKILIWILLPPCWHCNHVFRTKIFSAATSQQFLLFLYNKYRELKDVSSSVILTNCKDLESLLKDEESVKIQFLMKYQGCILYWKKYFEP